MLAVASSRTIILERFRIALARQISCLCPSERFVPPAAMVYSRVLSISSLELA